MNTTTLTTNTKIETVWKCAGEHITPGLTILRAGRGYVCPKCGNAIKDITETDEGRQYFGWLRPDLWRQK